jgi:hypothetical protein
MSLGVIWQDISWAGDHIFTSQNIAWEWNVSPYLTLTSVVNFLFCTRYPHCKFCTSNCKGYSLPSIPRCCGSPVSLKLQYHLVIKFYYSTRLCHLHCCYPLHACTLEHEITTARYRQLSHLSRPQIYYSEDIHILLVFKVVGWIKLDDVPAESTLYSVKLCRTAPGRTFCMSRF